MAKSKTVNSNCRFFRVCKSTRKGTWCDCSLGKGLICNTKSEYCKFEPLKEYMPLNTSIKNGVDVSGCGDLDKNGFCDLYSYECFGTKCEDKPNCYYKQYQRLYRENMKLKMVNMLVNTNDKKLDCKYAFQDGEKFNGEKYCTLFNELCNDISFVCDANCQVYEDYKQLQAYKEDRFCQGGCAVYQYDKIQNYTAVLKEIREYCEKNIKTRANCGNFDYTVKSRPLLPILDILKKVKGE